MVLWSRFPIRWSNDGELWYNLKKMNDQLERMLRLGEDSVREFKAMRIPGRRVTEPDAKEIADDIASAANAAGAAFFFGINDKTHEVEGIPEDKLDVAETWIRDICNDSVKPAVQATIRKVAVRDSAGAEKCVVRVDVPKSLFVHEGPHGYFYRIGSSRRKMPPEMLARLFQQRSQTRLICFDEQVVSTARADELVPSLYSRFRSELSPADDFEFLRKLHFLSSDVDGVMRPTVAGVLFATEQPEKYLPSAYIQAVCYRGTDRTADDQLDARDITGPLDVQIAEACHFVERNMRVAAIKNPGRIDIPQYAMNAVFEAVVNAVAHRDYSISGSKIRLHMFSDRLELFSPGGLPNSLELDEIGMRQFARNELVCTCLSRCPVDMRLLEETHRERIMDKRGEGVPVIISASGRLSGVRPEYRLLGGSELMLTIHSVPVDDRRKLRELALNIPSHAAAARTTQVTAQVRPKTTQVTTQVRPRTTQVTTQVRRMLHAIDGEMSVDEIRLKIGIADRRDFVRRFLSPALKSGCIEMTQPDSRRSPTQKYRITEFGIKICEGDEA